jgi:hypothetical protein
MGKQADVSPEQQLHILDDVKKTLVDGAPPRGALARIGRARGVHRSVVCRLWRKHMTDPTAVTFGSLQTSSKQRASGRKGRSKAEVRRLTKSVDVVKRQTLRSFAHHGLIFDNSKFQSLLFDQSCKAYSFCPITSLQPQTMAFINCCY